MKIGPIQLKNTFFDRVLFLARLRRHCCLFHIQAFDVPTAVQSVKTPVRHLPALASIFHTVCRIPPYGLGSAIPLTLGLIISGRNTMFSCTRRIAIVGFASLLLSISSASSAADTPVLPW